MKVDQRPNLVIEETAFTSSKSTVWIPGKSQYQDTTITYYDVDNDEGGALFLRWFSEQFRALSPENDERKWQSESTTVILRLLDGCGDSIEMWYLEGAFIVSADFGDGGYTTCPDVELRVAVRYRDVEWMTGKKPPVNQDFDHASVSIFDM